MKRSFILIYCVSIFFGCGSSPRPEEGFSLCELKKKLTSGVKNNDFNLFSKAFYLSSYDDKEKLKKSFELQSAYAELFRVLKDVFPEFSIDDFYKFTPSGNYLSVGAPTQDIEDFFYINEPNIGLALMYRTTRNDLIFFRVIEMKEASYLLRPHSFFISFLEDHTDDIIILSDLTQNLLKNNYLTIEEFIYDLHKRFIPLSDWVVRTPEEQEELAEQIKFILSSGYERVDHYRSFIVDCK